MSDWCYLCGKRGPTIVVRGYCPFCTADVEVRMCLSCAYDLYKQLQKFFSELSGSAKDGKAKVVRMSKCFKNEEVKGNEI